MNRKDIVTFLENIGPSQFHKLGDSLLSIYKGKYKDLIPKGNHIYEDKTIKGTPDSYKYVKDHIIAVQYTVSKTDIKNKLLKDIEKIIEWNLFGSVNEIMLVSNSRQDDDAEKVCRDRITGLNKSINLKIIWIDNIITIIEKNYDAKVIMNQFSNINFIEISDKQDFKRYYWKTYYENKKSTLRRNRDTILDKYDLYLNIFDEKEIKNSHRSITNVNRAILFGKSGSGKSLILREVFLHSFIKCKSYSVFIDLNGYRDDNIINLLKRNLECEGIRISSYLIEQYLYEGKFFIIFDGFDEIDIQTRKRLINDFFKDTRFEKNRFLISSRYNIDEVKFIENYAAYYLKDISKRKIYKKVLKKLITKEDCLELKSYLKIHKLESFLSNPLNLSFLINILEKKQHLSIEEVISILKNEIFLYSNYIEKVVEWEIKKNFHVNISAKHIEKILEFIAYYMIENYILEIDEDEIENLISQWVKNKCLDYEIVDIKSILINTIFYLYNGKFKFSHKNLKIYLAYKSVNEELYWEKVILHPLFEDVIIWVSLIDNKFLVEHIQQLPIKILIKILLEIENEKVDIFLKYIEILFDLELEGDLKSKIKLIFQRFRYDELVLDIVFRYLRRVSIGKEDFDDLLDNDIKVKTICDRDYYSGIIINSFSKNYSTYNILNKRWIDEGKNNKLIKIISFYMLSFIMNESEANDEIFQIYYDAFKSMDEQIVYNSLLSVSRYIFIDDRFSILNVYGLSAQGKRLISLFKSLNRNISRRVEILASELDSKICINSDFSIKELFARIKNYKRNKDYNIGLDFAKSREVNFFRDEIIEFLGKKGIGEVLTYSLKHKEYSIEDTIEILDCIYFYNLTDENIMIEVLKLFHREYNNKFEEDAVKTECLKVVCGRVCKGKLETLYKVYKDEIEEKNKILLIWGLWIILKAYPEILSSQYSMYLKNFKEELDSFKHYVSLTIKEFLWLSSKIWNWSVYIKDYDNDSERWSHKYKYFFYDIIGKINKRTLLETFFELQNSNNEEFEDIVIDVIKSLKDRKWLQLLEEKNNSCWNRRASEILYEWSEE